MLNIQTIASGSTGNCYVVFSGKQSIMIEAGVPLSVVRGWFSRAGKLLTDIDFCLCSHGHADHTKSADKIMRAGIDCYMTAGTATEAGLSGHRLKVVEPLKQFSVSGWIVLPFRTIHDVADPVGFLIQGPEGDKLLFATDTAYLKHRFSGLTHIMIEANYCPEILAENIRAGEYPRSIRNRVVKNHMSINTAVETLKANDISRVREIHLLHLSKDNGNPVEFKRKVQAATGKPVYIAEQKKG